MANKHISPTRYLRNNDLDPDVFFTGTGGPITPEMRQDWIESHEGAIDHPGVEYDDETGFYNYSFRVPEAVEEHYRENRERLKETFDDSGTTVSFTSAGIYIMGSVQTPGSAILTAKLVEQLPLMVNSSL